MSVAGSSKESACGRVVGSSTSASGNVPFTWTQSEGMSALPTLGSYDRASGVNAAGWVVGDWLDGEHKPHGIVWRPSGSQPLAPSTLHLSSDIRYGIPVSGLNFSGDRTLYIAGYGEPGGTVTLYRDGVAVAALTIDSEASSWSIVDTAPADGVYSYTAKLSADGGDSSLSPPLVVTVDTSGSATAVYGPPDGAPAPRRAPATPAGDAHGGTSIRGATVAIGRARATMPPLALDARVLALVVAGEQQQELEADMPHSPPTSHASVASL